MGGGAAPFPQSPLPLVFFQDTKTHLHWTFLYIFIYTHKYLPYLSFLPHPSYLAYLSHLIDFIYLIYLFYFIYLIYLFCSIYLIYLIYLTYLFCFLYCKSRETRPKTVRNKPKSFKTKGNQWRAKKSPKKRHGTVEKEWRPQIQKRNPKPQKKKIPKLIPHPFFSQGDIFLCLIFVVHRSKYIYIYDHVYIYIYSIYQFGMSRMECQQNRNQNTVYAMHTKPLGLLRSHKMTWKLQRLLARFSQRDVLGFRLAKPLGVATKPSRFGHAKVPREGKQGSDWTEASTKPVCKGKCVQRTRAKPTFVQIHTNPCLS